MMEAESMKWLASLGVGGAIAGFMFLYYRRDMLAAYAQLNTLSEQWKQMNDRVLSVVIDETRLNSEMVTLLRALHRRLDMDGTLADAREDERRRRSQGAPDGRERRSGTRGDAG